MCRKVKNEFLGLDFWIYIYVLLKCLILGLNFWCNCRLILFGFIKFLYYVLSFKISLLGLIFGYDNCLNFFESY